MLVGFLSSENKSSKFKSSVSFFSFSILILVIGFVSVTELKGVDGLDVPISLKFNVILLFSILSLFNTGSEGLNSDDLLSEVPVLFLLINKSIPIFDSFFLELSLNILILFDGVLSNVIDDPTFILL